MKAIGILHHDCSPNYFRIELCGSVAIFTNPQIFYYLKWSTRSCADEPKCNSQFPTIVTQMKHLSFCLHSMQYTFSIWCLPHMLHGPWQSLQFCMDFNHLRMVLRVYYKCMHLLIAFNPGATWLCPLTEILVANSSIFSLQLKKSFSNTFPHFHITMNSASPKQSHPHSHKWFTWHGLDHSLCFL